MKLYIACSELTPATPPKRSPRTKGRKSSAMSRRCCRTNTKSGLKFLGSRKDRREPAENSTWPRKAAQLPNIAIVTSIHGNDATNSSRLGISAQGEIAELRLLHFHVEVASESLSTEVFRPAMQSITIRGPSGHNVSFTSRCYYRRRRAGS